VGAPPNRHLQGHTAAVAETGTATAAVAETATGMVAAVASRRTRFIPMIRRARGGNAYPMNHVILTMANRYRSTGITLTIRVTRVK
jgi:hypothetical protein